MRLSDLPTFGPALTRKAGDDAATHAAAWTRDLAERLLEPLMDETGRILLEARWIATAPDPLVAAAALVSWIPAQYASGRTLMNWSTDSWNRWLRTTGDWIELPPDTSSSVWQ